jgi:AraC-like DNA-binding protein
LSIRNHQVKLQQSAVAGIEAMTFASNHSFPRHSHDQYGVGVLRSGSQRSWSGIGQVESFPGDVITVNPGEMHDGMPLANCVRRWQMLYFDPEFLVRQMQGEVKGEVEFIRPSLHDAVLRELFGRLFTSLTAVADPLAAEEALLRLITRMVRGNGQSGRSTPSVVKARARIDADPGSPVTLTELAAISNTSRSQLVRAFDREAGATPHAYIVQRRVQMARQSLLAGESLAATALMSGFADQSHLTRTFARQFGVTPGRYIAARSRPQFPSRRLVSVHAIDGTYGATHLEGSNDEGISPRIR